MRSVLRGVLLAALGATLCAGLVFTADRTLNNNSGKADRARFVATSFAGSEVQPTHPNRVRPVTRDEIMNYLIAAWAPHNGASTPAEIETQLLLDRAGHVGGKNADLAINLLQQVAGAELPASTAVDSMKAQANLMLAEFSQKADDARSPLKAAHYYQRAVQYMDPSEDREVIAATLRLSAQMFASVGHESEAAQAENRAEAVARGLSSVWIQDDRFSGNQPNDPGPDDTCAGAVDVTGSLPNYSEVMSILQPDVNWRSFTLSGAAAATEGHQVRIETLATPATFDDDTDLTLWDGCGGNAIAFDDDSGAGFSSLLNLCLADGTYYLEVGGWADLASPNDFELQIEDGGAGSCFIAAADEFEPDDFLFGSQIPLIGCPTLDLGDHHGDHDSDDSSDDSHDSHSGKGGGTPPPDDCQVLQTQCRTIAPAGDVDIAYFNVGAEPRQVTVTTAPAADCGSPEGAAPSIVQAMTDDSGALFYATIASSTTVCLPGNRDFNIFVAGLDSSATFAYQLTVDATAPCAFETEPNSTCEDAQDLGAVAADGTLVSIGAIHTPFYDPFGAPFFTPITDHDWFTFTLPEACTVRAETTAPAGDGRVDTEIELYDGCPDAGGNSIAFDDDSGSVVWTSRVDVALPAGTYWVRASESAVFGPGLPYVYGVAVRCVPPPQDDQEPNDDPCAPFSVGSLVGMVTLDGAVFPTGDQDYFGFSLAADSIVGVSTTGPVSGADTTINLSYDTAPPSCSLLNLCCDDDSGAGPGPFYSNLSVCLPAGDYLVGLQSYNQLSQIEDYSVTISNNGACFADATPENNVCVSDEGFGCPF